VAAALLADMIEKGCIFSRMLVTVQKEVALRMAASAGSPDYSSFSVLCASAYKVKPLMLIRRESFYPQPNVDSMGVLLESRNVQAYPAVFYPLVRALFASRRKTVKNNLLAFLSSRQSNARELCTAILQENAVNENERAENLELETFLSLAKYIDNMRIYKKEC
jgi:16S rRNA (adenine1518-N6/adenine1519-N6)-dimethyltransferase